MNFDRLYNLIVEEEDLLLEGGAAGHMDHPFDLPNISNGRSLINLFKNIVESLASKKQAVKIDGINVSVKLVNLNGRLQFAIDRGTTKDIDVQGVTIDYLNQRFNPDGDKSNHIIIVEGKKYLTALNESIPTIKPELIELGLYDKDYYLLNIELVNGPTNVIQYSRPFIAIHNVIKMINESPKKRVARTVPYSEEVLARLAEKIKPFLLKYGYDVYPTIYTSTNIDKDKIYREFDEALQQRFDIVYKDHIDSKTLKERAEEAINVKRKKIDIMNSDFNVKKVEALSKLVYVTLLNKSTPIDEFVVHDTDYKLAIDGAVIYHITRVLGQIIINNVKSESGESISEQEGIVINDPSIYFKDFKVTGDFIIKSLKTPFNS